MISTFVAKSAGSFRRNCLKILLLLFLLPTGASAHSTGEGYIFMRIYEHSVTGRFEFTCDDLNKALGLPDSSGIVLTVDNAAQFLPQIQQYVNERIHFSAAGNALPIHFTGMEARMIEKLSNFVLLDFTLLEELETLPAALDIEYRMLFDREPQHRGLLVIEHFWRANLFDNERVVSLVFDAAEPGKTLDLASYSVWTGFFGVVRLGVKHILEGTDHILFLIALILPAVMYREEKKWKPVQAFKPALINVIKIVSLFTVAHSLTLSAAALGILELPSRLVESIIAISIAIAALDILFPIFRQKMWMVVFGFGLFHGFGFAGVLSHLGVLGEHMALSLFGFNLGVEVGQVAVISLVFPVLFLLRKYSFYNAVLLRAGSVLLILVAMMWLYERAIM